MRASSAQIQIKWDNTVVPAYMEQKSKYSKKKYRSHLFVVWRPTHENCVVFLVTRGFESMKRRLFVGNPDIYYCYQLVYKEYKASFTKVGHIITK